MITFFPPVNESTTSVLLVTLGNLLLVLRVESEDREAGCTPEPAGQTGCLPEMCVCVCACIQYAVVTRGTQNHQNSDIIICLRTLALPVLQGNNDS